jgi:ADP-ribosylglycohydrolase
MEAFRAWWWEGEYCSFRTSFGLGGNISKALDRFDQGIPAELCGGTGFRDNGNGALMRILPFSLLAILRSYDLDKTVRLVSAGSSLTHAHEISRLGCCLFTEFLRSILLRDSKEDALLRVRNLDWHLYFTPAATEEYPMFLVQDTDSWNETALRETGYVADTLQAAVFSIMKTGSYEEAVSAAVRLGYDTDTTACVTGQLAAGLYGKESIPVRWLEKLRRREYLLNLSSEFASII